MTAGSLIRRMVLLGFALAVVLPAPMAQARSKPDPDKYAHKVEKKLSNYKKGALLHLVFVNNTESTGTLAQLGEGSFTFVNLDTNTTETHKYADVESIGKGSETVGGQSRKRHGIF
jgi:hypothetical protein